MARHLTYTLLGLGLASVCGLLLLSERGGAPGAPNLASLVVPDLSADEEAGRRLFESACAECHGPNAAGSASGPPLVHAIYKPSHHGDMAFVLAARQGVRAHHWRFGDMPAVAGVTDDDVRKIIAYVRALQQANGIY